MTVKEALNYIYEYYKYEPVVVSVSENDDSYAFLLTSPGTDISKGAFVGSHATVVDKSDGKVTRVPMEYVPKGMKRIPNP